MDRRTLVVGAALLSACAKPSVSRQNLATGVLSYDVAWLGCSTLASVELGTRFLLQVRSLAGQARPPIDLGPPDYDISRMLVRTKENAAWIASRDGTVRRFDLDSGKPEWTLRLGSPATAIALDHDYLVTGSASGVLCLRRRSDLALLQCVAAHRDEVSDLKITNQGLWSSGHDGLVVHWQLPSLRRLAERKLPGSANAIAISSTGTVAVATSSAPPRRSRAVAARERRGESAPSVIALWAGSQEPRFLNGHTGPVTDVAWDSATLLSTSWDRSIRRWHPKSGRSQVLARFGHLGRRLAGCGPNLLAAAAWSTAQDEGTTVVLRGQNASFGTID